MAEAQVRRVCETGPCVTLVLHASAMWSSCTFRVPLCYAGRAVRRSHAWRLKGLRGSAFQVRSMQPRLTRFPCRSTSFRDQMAEPSDARTRRARSMWACNAKAFALPIPAPYLLRYRALRTPRTSRDIAEPCAAASSIPVPEDEELRAHLISSKHHSVLTC